MEHSHPLPDGQNWFSGDLQVSRISNASHTTSSPIHNALAIQRPYESLSPYHRRLQLRNAGFRGSVIPARRISPLLGATAQASESFSSPLNDENSPRSSERRSLYRENLPPSPVNILQEIHNSAQRGHQARIKGTQATTQVLALTEDGTESTTSWYHVHSNDCSPLPLNETPSTMLKLRDGSLNERTPPPLSSPLAKHGKGRKSNRVHHRSASLEATKYIEHLESQLAAVNTKLEALTSPTRTRTQSTKLKALNTEARALRQEVTEWEQNFAEKVREDKGQRMEMEVGLKARIKVVEDELETKDARIKELEWELENMAGRIKHAEALEEINMNLERRIDVLTELVVQSPTKLDISSTVSSPSKRDTARRTPRPKSMLPRIPSSPGGLRLSLTAVTEAILWQGRSRDSTSSIAESPEECIYEPFQQEAPSETILESQPSSATDSCCIMSPSLHSVQSFPSRPTSLHSSTSVQASSWGLPLPVHSEYNAPSVNRQKKMRRFPSGNCQLKPLILPTAAGTPSLPASAPIYASEDRARRSFTNYSMNPTSAFLSMPESSSPISTPTQQGRQRSVTWQQKRALDALEGRLGSTTPGNECEIINSPIAMSGGEPSKDLVKEYRELSGSRAQTLMNELEQVKTSTSETFEDGLIPVDAEADGEPAFIPTRIESAGPFTATLEDNLIRRRLRKGQHVASSPTSTRAEKSTTTSPARSSISSRSALLRSPKSVSSSALATTNAHGMFTKLASVITSSNQDPLVLARRFLRQAWLLGSAQLGGMGWWLIGLVFGHQGRKKKHVADQETGERPKSASGVERHHNNEAAGSLRTAEIYLRNRADSLHTVQLKKPPREPSEPAKHTYARHSSTTSLDACMSAMHPIQDMGLSHCSTCVEPASRHTIRLWFRFSLAVILSVGIAIKNGPGALLVDGENSPDRPLPERPKRPPTRFTLGGG